MEESTSDVGALLLAGRKHTKRPIDKRFHLELPYQFVDAVSQAQVLHSVESAEITQRLTRAQSLVELRVAGVETNLPFSLIRLLRKIDSSNRDATSVRRKHPRDHA